MPEQLYALHVPAELHAPEGAAALSLRPLEAHDEGEWMQVRMNNDEWLSPWESSDPEHGANLTFGQWIERQRRAEQEGTAVVFAITYYGRIVGQISLGSISYGALRSGIVGYWVDESYIGRGFAPLAVAMVCDWAMYSTGGPHLHRIEIDILPTNHRSRRVVEKVGARYEGIRRAYMYINGVWEDHESYALLAEDTTQGFTKRLLESAE
ncbi:acetyltransferase, GNAT family [Bifidobacterium dolichotidis]|uniref:Acetyltransferase, GNAT family n=1 Tax=Bifidobacterium dolichotidis TaxID=2306976 RepID=A0A430FQ85_9BIFI|nr:GNAT family protein [Bifidobacterium dolichotidis]RSX55003.1 acetyltransferase, GNAT family [Bifidobacterium dolichotidis]